ncbi:MAG TPA: hypothetical protein VE907_12890 [Gammaproteobacteria bacterium]|nr:hypothetical protein [Gammaproteobacteria bacterium]
MIRLTELVELLCDNGHKLRDANPRVVVRWYLDNGELVEREIEMVYADLAGGVSLHCPRPAQLAGEPGAGDVIDESDDELDIDMVLRVALNDPADQGVCACKPGQCMLPNFRGCRTRHRAELVDRQRKASG